MDSYAPDRSALVPLAYHATVVDYLRRNEPEVWRWASARTGSAEQREELRSMLLRDTYRLDAEAHADVHAALEQAMKRLGIEARATLYQSPGQAMNASLFYVPDEVHIIVQGPLLERLSTEELTAVLGHELAHYLLWSRDDGQFLVVDRILNDALAAPGSSSSHRETYRRYALHTELFADRGGAVAAGAVAPAVSTLVKVQTGINSVDAAAYLRQAEEIESHEAGASAAHTHPETFIRARALALWWEQAENLDSWIETRLHGPLGLERLDLPGQARLQQLTRGFLAHYLAGTPLASDAVQAQLRMLFPDWQDNEPVVGPDAFADDIADESIRDYLNALMMDLALADPDQQEVALLRAGKVARGLGSFDALQNNLRRDAGFSKRDLERYRRQLDAEIRA
ncbi:M48 family metalloprotease [Paraburkholderia megapolitana]|uniref:Zn-dependent protease with chaperone function n=1 Tax=Paraburkholderia megapolitana TaxID=420953 RepID=A0A1I3UBZ4_9BURK|nr:M48 family metalloprotease [Paraburkholderia megapolitana]QDQ83594.1 M48 family metalloprotease [Paraburkholderia megapolitana]SFJ80139.1 Zn-dependent protease with chaperone function [Paraburkholderia megapolitana]